MKYRILEQNGNFFPQYKDWFCWNYFKDGMIGYPLNNKSFSTLDDSKKWLNSYINMLHQSKIIKFHDYP